MSRTITLTLLSTSGLLAMAPLATQPPASSRAAASCKVLAAFPREKQTIESWMEANGWQSKRNDPAAWGVRDGCLHMVSRGDSVLIGVEFDDPIDVRKYPRARVRFRIGTNPSGMDLSKKRGDDAAFRVYFAFGRSRSMFRAPPTLAYTWTGNTPAGERVASAHDSNLHYISIGRGVPETKPGEWITIECNLVADYEKVFDGKPTSRTPLTAILLKCDSNDTGTSAEAWLESVELLGSGSI